MSTKTISWYAVNYPGRWFILHAAVTVAIAFGAGYRFGNFLPMMTVSRLNSYDATGKNDEVDRETLASPCAIS